MKAILKQNIKNQKTALKGSKAGVGASNKLSAKQIELLSKKIEKTDKLNSKNKNFADLLKMNLTAGKKTTEKKDINSLIKMAPKVLEKELMKGKGLSKQPVNIADLKDNKKKLKTKKINKKVANLNSTENLVALSKFNKVIKRPSTYKNSSEGSFIKTAKKIDKAVEVSNESKLNQSIDNLNQIGQQKIQSSENLNENSLSADKPTLNLSATNIENKVELMDKISDYIVTNKIASTDSASMKVQHSELGQFEINVSKDMGNNEMSVQIISGSQAAQDFFNVNKVDMMTSLSKSGLQISDVKVENNSDSNMSDQNEGSFSGGSKKNFQSEQNQREQESQRRQELWEILEERQAA